MNMRISTPLHLNSDDGKSHAHVPPFEELSASGLLSRKAYIRVHDFLDAEVAQGAYAELMEDRRYVRVKGNSATAKPAGYRLGILKSVNESLSPNVQVCCDLVTSEDFRNWLAGLVGHHHLQTVKPPSLFRMEQGDEILKHDDISDSPLNRVSVVLHLSKNWKREFGGNTVLGEVKRVENMHLPESKYLEHRWVFSHKLSILTPVFNSLIIIALRAGMAHGVSSVRVKACRVSIVGLYALEAESAEPPPLSALCSSGATDSSMFVCAES